MKHQRPLEARLELGQLDEATRRPNAETASLDFHKYHRNLKSRALPGSWFGVVPSCHFETACDAQAGSAKWAVTGRWLMATVLQRSLW